MTEKVPAQPTFTGIHHLNFPVSDLSASADWYRLAFGAERVAEMDFAQADIHNPEISTAKMSSFADGRNGAP